MVKHDPGYINWLTRQPSPSNWLQHFLKDVNRFLDLKLEWDRVRTQDYVVVIFKNMKLTITTTQTIITMPRSSA